MKYIIDIPKEYESDWVNKSSRLGFELCFPINETATNKKYHIPTGLKLESYTEPDREAIEDEVWEFAQKFTHEPKAELNAHERVEIWGTASCDKIINDFTYSEAKAKYDAWKKQKEEEIHVGDEVFFKGDPHKEKAIVLRLYQPKMYKPVSDVLWADGSVEKTVLVEKLMRTGRHFDEVDELLKKMRGK